MGQIMKKLLIFTVLLVAISYSCKKVNIRKDYPELSGEYEWYNTSDTTGTLYTYNPTGDQYKIRIKDNSKVLIYKNGVKIYKETILSAQPDSLSPTGINLLAGKGYKEFTCTIDSGYLITRYLPFAAYTNEYKKVN